VDKRTVQMALAYFQLFSQIKTGPQFLLILLFGLSWMLPLYAQDSLTLYEASRTSNVSEVRRLLQQKADPNAVDFPTGETPLFVAGSYGAKSFAVVDSILTLLIEYGAHVSAKDNYGNTPLHESFDDYNSAYRRAFRLLESGAEIDAQNNELETPLFEAVKFSSFECVMLLLKSGANMHHVNKEGENPLHVAGTFGNIQAIKGLLDNGGEALLSQKDLLGRVPLFCALSYADPHRLSILREKLSKNLDMRVVDNEGNTLLDALMSNKGLEYTGQYGFSEGNKLIAQEVTALIQKGVSPTSQHRPTPYQVAYQKFKKSHSSNAKKGLKVIWSTFNESEYDYRSERREVDNMEKSERFGDLLYFMDENKFKIAISMSYLLLSIYTRQKAYGKHTKDNWMLPVNSTVICAYIGGAVGIGAVRLTGSGYGAIGLIPIFSITGCAIGGVTGLVLGIKKVDSPFLYYSAPLLTFPILLIQW
jgi:ankyrin repeat protein